MEQSDKIWSFSCVRTVSCIAIVILHVFASATILFGQDGEELRYLISRGITNCMMWAVPCFVMTTGALLLDEKRTVSYKKIYGRYVVRILTALVVFCMIFRIFDMFMNGEDVSIGVFLNGIYKIITGTSWSHMWYLYLLIGLYLLLPFYRKIAGASEKYEIKYLLAIYVIFISVLPMLKIWGISSGFYIHVSTILDS